MMARDGTVKKSLKGGGMGGFLSGDGDGDSDGDCDDRALLASYRG
jgi:hypothetical protein